MNRPITLCFATFALVVASPSYGQFGGLKALTDGLSAITSVTDSIESQEENLDPMLLKFIESNIVNDFPLFHSMFQ